MKLTGAWSQCKECEKQISTSGRCFNVTTSSKPMLDTATSHLRQQWEWDAVATVVRTDSAAGENHTTNTKVYIICTLPRSEACLHVKLYDSAFSQWCLPNCSKECVQPADDWIWQLLKCSKTALKTLLIHFKHMQNNLKKQNNLNVFKWLLLILSLLILSLPSQFGPWYVVYSEQKEEHVGYLLARHREHYMKYDTWWDANVPGFR